MKAQTESDRVTRVTGFGPVGTRHDDCLDPPRALEPNDTPVSLLGLDAFGRGPHGHDPPQVDPSLGQGRRSPGRQQPLHLGARHHRLDLSRAGRDHDLLPGMNAQRRLLSSGDHEWSRVDARDLLAVASVQRRNRLAFDAGAIRLLDTGHAHPDDDDVAVEMPRGDPRFGCRIRRLATGGNQVRAAAVGMMARDHDTASCRDLAGAHVADAVHHGQAVRAIAREAQASAAGRMKPGAQHRHQQVVTRLEVNRRPVYADLVLKHTSPWAWDTTRAPCVISVPSYPGRRR